MSKHNRNSGVSPSSILGRIADADFRDRRATSDVVTKPIETRKTEKSLPRQ